MAPNGSPRTAAISSMPRSRSTKALPVVFGPIADQRIDPDCRFGLVVACASRVERTVFLDQCERVSRPVLTLGLQDVDVGEQKDGLQLRIPARVDGHEP